MTDSRLERIISQLADFDEQELNFIIEKICLERQERKEAKVNKLIENFKKAWDDLLDAGVDIYYYDNHDEWSLDVDSFHFYH